MYTRSYDNNLGIVIPESYNGTTFREEPKVDESIGGCTSAEEARCAENSEDIHSDKSAKSEPVGAFISRIIPKGFLGNFLKNDNFGLQKIGTEEILIIATAAFLLFSKDGDKECAIMLLLLLFLY